MDGRLLWPIARESQPALTIYLPRSHHTAQGWQGSGPGVRIFADFTSGKGLKAIAEALTSEGIPSPSAYDPARNRHRCGIAWAVEARPTTGWPSLTGTEHTVAELVSQGLTNQQAADQMFISVHTFAGQGMIICVRGET